MFGLSTITTTLIAIGFAVIMGFGSGYYTKGKFDLADQVKASNAAIAATAASAKTARTTDIQLAKESGAIDDRFNVTQKELSHGIVLSKPVKPAVVPGNTAEATVAAQAVPEVVCPVPVLSVRAVRVFNAFCAGVSADSAVGSDGEVTDPSDVGLPEVLAHDTKVVDLYRDLALRHDTLVDWVDKECSIARP